MPHPTRIPKKRGSPNKPRQNIFHGICFSKNHITQQPEMNLKKTRIPWTNLRGSEKIYKARSKSQFARERYGERMRILYELSWLWETLVIALAAAAVCVVCAMLICKAVKKNLSKKTAAVIGAAAFAGAVLAVIVIARTPMPLWLNGMLDCLCISTTYDLCVW